MKDLPNKINRIDVLRVEYGKRKLCECESPHYVIDYENRIVTCEDCGAVVEPFEALNELAEHYNRLGDQVQSLLDQRKQIASYKPQLVAIKNLEKMYRSNNYNMVPICPKCGAAFDLKDLASWAYREKEEKLCD